MALSLEQQQEVREILAAVYSDPSFNSPHYVPTEETLKLTETVLDEMQKCNQRIHILFNAVHCGMIGKGWLLRCLGGIKRILTGEARDFIPCVTHVQDRYLRPIKISMQN